MLHFLPTAPEPLAYRFDAQTSLNYKVDLKMDGFIPIMGGNEGTGEVKMGLSVKGQSPNGATLGASHELTEATVLFNENKIPLSLKNFTDFFPKTNLTFSPIGRITGNDAPNKNVPVKIPGFDARHLADLTFLPIEFPSEGLTKGSHWSFKKTLTGSEMTYDCTLRDQTDQVATIDVSVHQSFDYLENDAKEPEANPSDAVSKVTVSTEGKGVVDFDIKSGTVKDFKMDNTINSDVENLKDHTKTKRNLTSQLRVDQVVPGTARITTQTAKPEWSLGQKIQEWTSMAMDNPQVGMRLVQAFLTQFFATLAGSPFFGRG